MGHEQEEGGKWPYAGTAEAIKALGAKHCVKGVTISFLAARVAVAVAPGTPPLALEPGAPGSTCVTRVGSDAGACPSLAVFPSAWWMRAGFGTPRGTQGHLVRRAVGLRLDGDGFLGGRLGAACQRGE